MTNRSLFGGLLLASAFAVSCSHVSTHADKDGKPVYYAVAELKPTKGNKTHGVVHFAEAFGKVHVVAEVSGLQPKSKHGFHLHEFGDCTASDGSSAGGHYNPMSQEHGAPGAEHHHVGDLGNIEADAKGNAKLEIDLAGASINSGKNPILGRAVIVHMDADDLVSQPTGGAGKRIACGVIGAANK